MRSLFAILIAAILAAQTQEPEAVPVDQEPNHKVVFTNDYVRVIDATFPAGHVTLNHSHALDNVAVTISTGRGTAPGRAGFSKGGYAHRVTNSGTGIMRFIDVEILKSDRPGAAAASLPNHTLETENDRVRIYRVKLAAGESLPEHTHAAGWIEVTVTGGGGPGAYLWHGAGESSPLRGGPVEIVELEPK